MIDQRYEDGASPYRTPEGGPSESSPAPCATKMARTKKCDQNFWGTFHALEAAEGDIFAKQQLIEHALTDGNGCYMR